MSGYEIALFLLGLALLILGAEALVRGAAGFAVAIGISPLVIGLTVVAFGTSSPELAVSARAVLQNMPDISLGNVVGSNIFNVLFILGISAMIAPLMISRQLVRLDVPLLIGISFLALVFGLDGNIGMAEGIVFLVGITVYTIFLFYQSRKDRVLLPNDDTGPEPPKSRFLRRWVIDLGFILTGLAMLTIGARWLVQGAVTIAMLLGVSEFVIGTTIIAAGTSLPETATSVIASIRGQRDIAVGNIIGSNIFNILAVLGVAAVLAPNGITVAQAALRFDIPVMIAVAVACLPIFFTGSKISRWEGLLFLGYYIAYIVFLTLSSTRHVLLPVFSRIMGFFVIPLTAVTLIIISVNAIRTGRRKRSEL